jgi:hypothetical protein
MHQSMQKPKEVTRLLKYICQLLNFDCSQKKKELLVHVLILDTRFNEHVFLR